MNPTENRQDLPAYNPPAYNPPAYNPPAYNPNPSTMQVQQPPYVKMAPGYPPYPTYQYPQNNMVFVQDAVPVVTTQTTMVTMPLPNYVSEYMGYSIVNMIWCFFPLGLAALIFSCKTRSCNQRGDVTGAQRNSRTALILNHIALSIGIAITVIWVSLVIYYSVRKTTSSSSSSSSSGYYDYYYYISG